MSGNFKFDWVVVERLVAKGGAEVSHTFAGADLVAAAPRNIRVESMTAAEADETLRSEKVSATLVDMPTCLIEPASRADGSAAPRDISWGIRDLGDSSWKGENVVVAVLDTGIDTNHPAFKDMTLVREDFTGEGLEDTDGHGTHCAGTIFGRDVTGVRIGVARGVKKALIGKVLGKGSGGSTQSLVKALHWAQYNGADVISMSLGMDFPGYLERLLSDPRLKPRQAASIALEAYRLNLEMFNKLSTSIIGVPGVMTGSLVIAAAGNESEVPNYTIAASLPANALDFVSVSALYQSTAGAYSLAPFSNVGAKLGAPGTSIWSAKAGGGLVQMDGTSMAAPHVAGAACLWIEKLRSETTTVNAPDVIERLKTSAASLTPMIPSDAVRWGRVRVPF